MKRIALFVVAVALVAGVVTALARASVRANGEPTPQSAKEARGATPYAKIVNEAPPKLIVDPTSSRPVGSQPQASSGSNGGWRTFTSYRALSHREELDVCASTYVTYPI